MNNSEEQKKEVYYRLWAATESGKVAIQPIFPKLIFALGLSRKKNWEQGERYV
jgi:hypothetical protein